jgi:hypothetical protein
MRQRRQKVSNSPLSNRCQEIILGSLLGDGSLTINEHYQNARFSFRHSITQKDYFFWKVRELKEISGKNCWWIQEKDGRSQKRKIRYQSQALPVLTKIYLLTHKGKKFRVQRKWLNKLTPLSLAVWWMDDGALIANGRKGVFCTDNFSYKEHLILSRYLRKVWGVKTKVGERKKGSGKYRLWFRSTEELKKFLKIILPFIVESMLPKVLLLYKDSLSQQRWISEVSSLTRFPEKIIKRHLEIKKKKWKNFRE